MINDKMQVTGDVTLTLTDEKGNLKARQEIKNLVVNTGLTFINERVLGTSQAVMSHMALGSGTNAAANTRAWATAASACWAYARSNRHILAHTTKAVTAPSQPLRSVSVEKLRSSRTAAASRSSHAPAGARRPPTAQRGNLARASPFALLLQQYERLSNLRPADNRTSNSLSGERYILMMFARMP